MSDAVSNAGAVADLGRVTLPTLAPVLGATQGAFLAASGREDALLQPGGVELDEPFPVPVPAEGEATYPAGGEPILETFVVNLGPDGARQVEPTGADASVATWWRPSVEALVERVWTEAREVDIELGFPAFVSVSTTPAGQVESSAHLDDDQPRLDAGVGLVAIAASGAGTRIVRGAIGCRRLRPPAPIEVDAAAMAAFEPGADAEPGGAGGHRSIVESFDADRIVVLARFGQLHAGPVLDSPVGDETAGDRTDERVRSLLVLRADTIPVASS